MTSNSHSYPNVYHKEKYNGNVINEGGDRSKNNISEDEDANKNNSHGDNLEVEFDAE